MGTPEFAVPSLRRLVAEGYNVVGAVTVPDKPAGRGRHLRESDVKIAARELGVPVLQPEKFRDPAFLDALQALQPDLGIVIAFKMLPEVVWAMPRLGTFNLHASLLPEYRGRGPDQLGHHQRRTRNGYHDVPAQPRNRQGGDPRAGACRHRAGGQRGNALRTADAARRRTGHRDRRPHRSGGLHSLRSRCTSTKAACTPHRRSSRRTAASTGGSRASAS